MKLQKHFAYKYKEKKHYKHIIVVPKEIVKKLGWDAGVELRQQVNGGALVIKPIAPSNEQRNRVSK